MAPSRDKLLLFGAAIALRLLLVVPFPKLSDLLLDRVEISTPITSFKRCKNPLLITGLHKLITDCLPVQEGLFLYTHNVSPYDGGVYHQAPLLLPLFSLLPDARTFPLWTTLVYALTDLLSASALIRIAESGEARSSRLFTSPRKTPRWSSMAIASAFLFNPFTIATCIARPTIVFTHCAILQAIAAAVSGQVTNSVLALATASYLSMYPILLTPSLLLLAYDRKARNSKEARPLAKFSVGYVLLMGGALNLLLYASHAVMGFSWEFLASTYGVHLLLSDLSPNVGLWWYFFVEMFDSFREFFLGVFWLQMASYTGGGTIRFRKQPLFAAINMLGIIAILKPYPSISDASLFLALLPIYSHVFPLLRYSFIGSAALLYATFLGPAFYHLWIYAGSGNANFFYAITLVWSLGLTVFVADAMWAVLRDEFEVERPDIVGKDVKQI